jgi:hypothetical protein
MERLNALEWADGLCFSAYGVRMGIRVTVPQLIPALLERLPPDWKPSTTRNVQWLYSLVSVPSRHQTNRLLHTLYSGPDHLTQGSDFQRIRRILASDIQIQLALTTPWRVFVHAGVVAWKGKAVVMPGDNGSGKSTLTAALVRAGAELLSDEFAVLDRKGRVHPYPLPVRIREGGRGRSMELTAGDMGGSPASGPRPVALVLSLRYDPRGSGQLQGLSRGRGALELLAHATQVRIRPDRVMASAGRAVERARIFKGRRGEAEDLVEWIISLLED